MCTERTRNQWYECQQPRKQQEPGPSPLGSVFKLYLLVVLVQSLTELAVLSITFRPISKNSPFNTDWQEFQWFTSGSSQVAQMVKNLSARQKTLVWSLGGEDPLEEGMATNSSVLSWRTHGQRSLAGYSPWGCKKSDMTERLTHPSVFHTEVTRENYGCHTNHTFSSVAHLCLTLCNPMNHSMPGLPVHHQLPEFTQTHVHCVADAIQPFHPLSSPSPPALNLSQH